MTRRRRVRERIRENKRRRRERTIIIRTLYYSGDNVMYVFGIDGLYALPLASSGDIFWSAEAKPWL
jgi:hypothetical protein